MFHVISFLFFWFCFIFGVQSSLILQRVGDLLERYAAHIDVEVQQRAVEYLQLIKQEESIRREVTQRMPVLDEEQMKTRGLVEKPIGADEAG